MYPWSEVMKNLGELRNKCDALIYYVLWGRTTKLVVQCFTVFINFHEDEQDTKKEEKQLVKMIKKLKMIKKKEVTLILIQRKKNFQLKHL